MLPISVFIIAKNEADRIELTIESVHGWVHEVIVVDSGSTDGTVAVSEKLGARVTFHAWEGYGPQKRFGESLCTQPWLLNLDADEAISPELAQEIRHLFASGEPSYAAYRLKIKALYRFQNTLPRFAPGTVQTRLYRKDSGSFRDALVHDAVVLESGVRAATLKHPVIHRSFRGLAHAVEKINFYSGLQAEDMVARGRCPSWLVIVITPVLAFLKSYFLRRYFLYGVDGVVQSYVYAFSRFLRLAKAREIFQGRSTEGSVRK